MELQARNKTLDSLRGIAIIIMIAANSWPYIYPFDTCPFFIRILFSTAAPIFIFISGYVNGIQNTVKNQSNLFKRPIQILILAVIIDCLVWHIVPLVTFDVLYLIAISILVLRFLKELNKNIIALIALVLLFANTFFLSKYDFNFSEISFEAILDNYNIRKVLNHLFFDGWFPLFPWMGVFFLGYYLSNQYENKKTRIYLYGGSFFILAYIILINLKSQPIQPLRKGYTELFYPLTGGFWFYLIGLLSILTYLIKQGNLFNKYLSILGIYSLPIYVLHTIVISFILPFFIQDPDKFLLQNLIIIMALFYFIIVVYVLLLNKFKFLLKKGALRYLGYVLGL